MTSAMKRSQNLSRPPAPVPIATIRGYPVSPRSRPSARRGDIDFVRAGVQ